MLPVGLRHNAEVCILSSLQTADTATRLCASSSGAAFAIAQEIV